MSRRRAGLIAMAATLVTLGAVRVWPRTALRETIPLSAAVWSSDGELLRVTRTSDDQFRIWVPLREMSPNVVQAFLLKEDRWFYWHPGLNPLALARAVVRALAPLERSGGRRHGASTITMQFVRLRHRLHTRTPAGKLRQVMAAVWLELRYSKRDILEAYLNVVPFGGNVQGVGTASRVYFDKDSAALTPGEAITLAVIPQHPAARGGGPAAESALLAARTQLARDWMAYAGDLYQGSSESAALADLERQLTWTVVGRAPHGLPQRALHFADAVLAATRGRHGRIDTTLDWSLQRLVERQLALYLRQFGPKGIRNATALLVDTRDMAVKAWVGSANYWDATIDGQVNGVTARRSPGSTLKPFVYALAVDQGVLHPRTMLRDAPSAFGPYTPENFDGRFAGPISAEDALVRSRNIPAVWVAQQLKQPTLYQFLQTAGVRNLQPEAFYGLALPLGGGEVTMEELVTLYAALANGGERRPLRTLASEPAVEGVRLLSAEAAFVTLDMLRKNPRPDSDAAIAVRTRWPVAWKTGTSWGFRDAWSAGVVGPYVLAVWIGDFRGQGNPAFIGTDAAAPLFFRIADALNLARPADAADDAVAPPGLTRIAVCAESGDLPNADCPHTVETWYIPGKSPIRVSQLHRAVGVDPFTGRPVCPPYPAGTRIEVFEYWPSDMLKLFRQSGMPRRTPPVLPDCATATGGDAPRIASPLRSVAYALHPSGGQASIPLEASASSDVATLFWFDGRTLIGAQPASAGPLSWRPVRPGVRTIRVVDDHGRSAERDVAVELGN